MSFCVIFLCEYDDRKSHRVKKKKNEKLHSVQNQLPFKIKKKAIWIGRPKKVYAKIHVRDGVRRKNHSSGHAIIEQ